LTQEEIPVYGSSRIAIHKLKRTIGATEEKKDGEDGKKEGEIKVQHWWANRYRTHKYFELSNHLGNVLKTITDRKLGIEDNNNPGIAQYYNPEIVSTSDYYPFGMQIAGRTSASGKE